MTRKVKYIPGKGLLMMFNKDSIKRGCNQVIEPTAFDRIPDMNYPIVQSFLHNDIDARCLIVLNEKGDTVLLDLAINTYLALPEMERD